MKRSMLILPALALALATSCAHVQPYASAPTVGVRWYGKTVIQPWPGLECAIDSALDIIAADYPGVPELRNFVVQVYGANDFFDEGSCVNATMGSDSKAHLLGGCTTRSCSSEWGYACTQLVLVREILSDRRYPTGNLSMPEFSGELLDAGTQGRDNSEQGRGVIFWEIADRLVPAILFELHKKASDGSEPVSSHNESGEPPAPVNEAMRNKMIARYIERGCATKTSPKN